MTETLAARRRRLLGPNVPTLHSPPPHIVRGEGCHLWDADGRRYLDAYNNVPHVGHGHPHVVGAVAAQMARLNIHSRYLHEGILDYTERLTATLGHGLTQMLWTCTGSEANDVALRMAQAATGRRGLIATDNTYHGNTAATADLGTRRPPIGGWPGHVRRIPAPDALAPGGLSAAGFAARLAEAAADLEAAGHGVAALILCPVFANEGLPGAGPGFLAPAQAVLRRAGGLLIADEVQPGFGRVGPAFWGHAALGAAPDIVTMGKPMGNGYPVAALATRPELMAAFREAFGYFNTFAATPVAAAAAAATLDVIEAEALPARAAATGADLLARLGALRHPRLASVRGAGLFLAVEFARGARPDGAACGTVMEAMRARGILTGRVGREQHILKLRPPLVFGAAQAEEVAVALAACLQELED